MQTPDHHPSPLEQAPVRALDPDGAGVVTGGTVAFAVAAGICWLEFDALASVGQDWWLWVCLAGVAIGLLGSAVAWTRHRRRKSGTAIEDPAQAPEAVSAEPPQGT